MVALVPAGLPDSVTFEPATGARTAEVFEIVRAEQMAAFGFCPDTQEDVRSWLEPPETTQTAQLLLRTRSDASPAQWWVVLRDQGGEHFYLRIRSHPALPDDFADELAGVGFSSLTDWIQSSASAEEAELQLRSGCPAGSAAGRRHLEAAGFDFRRRFWEMLGPVTEAKRSAPTVAGMTIVPARDVRLIHRMLDDAFTGHYGHESLGFEDWIAVEKSLAGYDPALWYVAEVEGSPVGAMLLSRRVEADGALYVAELATVEQYRRRGIASALLAHAFDVAAQKGFTAVSLHVDSENMYGAPSVYRRAGLEERCAFHAYGRDIPRSA